MENSKKWLKENNILPKISFETKQPRILTIVEDKLETIIDKEGKEVNGVKYKVVDENGDPGTVFTSSVALITKLAGVESGEKAKITKESYKALDGGFRTTYKVVKVTDGGEEELSPEDDDDIPVIEG